MAVIELMRRAVPYPLRTGVDLVLERSVESRVYGGQIETAHGRTGNAVAVNKNKPDHNVFAASRRTVKNNCIGVRTSAW